MNKIKVLAILGMAAGIANAAGDLWRGDAEEFPSLQVQTPGAKQCWAAPGNTPDADNDYGSPCYTQTGGWWFGYDYGNEAGTNKGDVRDATSGKSLVPTGAMNLTSEDDGSPIGGEGYNITMKAIDVKFFLKGGTDEGPSGAGIGFNWRKKEGTPPDFGGLVTEDISSYNGICLTYTLGAAGEGKAFVELGWNESVNLYNTWTFPLEASSSWKTVALTWADFKKSWVQAGSPDIDVAKKQAEALKFKAQNKTSSEVDFGFALAELGWNSTCTGGGAGQPNPIINKIVSGGKFSLVGRNLSLVNIGSASATVQVISMQGAVVAKKTLTENKTMSLANLPAGVYFVRSADLKISQKVVLK